ncbi:RNA polymerase sigma factor [Pinibacter soli]|uniref:Sigma-70 family RNA polymerase sigma factor n=1 Tax=Pinibacter soli TaxID=3044211 RepID=A0ABT6RH52_9BACT|nr:sigma-70 family RNA polymerase sigma factor [Pinibacter soli]MDI3321741.1 sigma-70 family RNA polymerase sigma factor [Pinibacter soli]
MIKEFEIWSEFQSGNGDAYAQLYKSFVSQLYSYGMKFTNDVTLVEDCIQDLFCTLWASKERLSVPGSVKNYLFKSLRNNLYKKINALPVIVEDDHALDFHFELSLDEKLTQNENFQQIKRQIEQALEKLTPRQREIIYYRFYQNMGFDEIADIMNMQVRATYKLTARALETLRMLIPTTHLFVLLFLLRTR